MTVSDAYTKKKEEALEQKKKKRMSAQQRQINQVKIIFLSLFEIKCFFVRILKNGKPIE